MVDDHNENDSPPHERNLADVCVPEGEKLYNHFTYYSHVHSSHSSPYRFDQQNIEKKSSSLWDL